ncbi:MAG TPA: lysylphosphatidylglycerol synthase transmembrane domain-containing protein [Parachlamydiaceae bacterium]|nr:lysylphosphatidylglycerol synthase transmembrane domain-containing protein [Parachlamydiaceae bacterium]
MQFHQHFISGNKFKIVLLTILMSIVCYFLFTMWAGWENVLAAFKQVGFLGITVALALSLFNFGMRFLRWHYFIRVLGYTIPWAPSLRIFMAGFSLTTTPGKTGEAVRGVFLKDYGVPFRKSFGAFLSERTSDLLSVTVLASAGLWFFPAARPVLFVVAAVIGFLFFAIRKDSWLLALERLAKKIFPEKFAHVIEFFLETVRSFRSCFTTKVMTIGLLLGVTAWVAEAMALLYLVHLLGYEITALKAIFIYGFSLVIGGITLLPGGLGGAEVTMIQLLILQSIPAPIAVAVTLVIRLTSLWFSVFLGMIALPKNIILGPAKK